jgi:hypothetical protein
MTSTQNDTADVASTAETGVWHSRAAQVSLVLLWACGAMGVVLMVWQVLRVSHGTLDVWLTLVSEVGGLGLFMQLDVSAARAGKQWWLSRSAPYLPLVALVVEGYPAPEVSTFGRLYLQALLVLFVLAGYLPTRARLIARAKQGSASSVGRREAS